jgi:hypothetical protein
VKVITKEQPFCGILNGISDLLNVPKIVDLQLFSTKDLIARVARKALSIEHMAVNSEVQIFK